MIKRPAYSIVAILAAALSVGTFAQGILTFDHGLWLHYEQSRVSGQDTASYQQAQYNFNLDMPAWTPELGQVSVYGILDYTRVAYSKRSSSSFSPLILGVHADLFRYRSFQLFLDYSHSEGPDLFGSGRVKGDNYGARFRYKGNSWCPTLDASYWYGSYRGPNLDQSWGRLEVNGNKRLKRTDYTFQFYRWDYGYGGGGSSGTEGLWVFAHTQLPGVWRLYSQLSANHGKQAWGLQVNETLVGDWKAWTSTSFLQASTSQFNVGSSEGLGLGQSLSYTKDKVSVYLAASAQGFSWPAVSVAGRTGVSRSNFASLYAGSSYSFAKTWMVLGDLSVARASGSGDLSGRFTGTNWTAHVGVGNGGSLPEAIRRTLFFIGDLRYERRFREEYPPGYVPDELAQDILQRRLRQSGSFIFSADYWRSKASNGGTLDTARINGTLNVGSSFLTQFVGNWYRDRDYLSRAAKNDHYDFTLYANWTLKWASFNLGGGYSKEDVRAIGSGPVNPLLNYSAVFYNASCYSRWDSSWGGMDHGFMVRYFDRHDGYATTTYTLLDNVQWRKIGFRVLYDYNVREDGQKWSRLTVDLMRAFDTLRMFLKRR